MTRMSQVAKRGPRRVMRQRTMEDMVGRRAVPPPDEGPRMPGEEVGGGRATESKGVGCAFEEDGVDGLWDGGLERTGPAMEA